MGEFEPIGAVGLGMASTEALRKKARDLSLRYGEHASDYVRARIEACETAGESGDAACWRQVLDLLGDGTNSELGKLQSLAPVMPAPSD